MDVLVWFICLIVLLVAIAGITAREFPWPVRGLIALAAAGTVASWLAFRYPLDQNLLLAVLLGSIAGASEVIARYRDEPFLALFGNIYGAAYIALNGIVAAAAFGLLFKYETKILPGIGSDPLIRAIVAGFGSSIVMRSKLFTVQTASGDEAGVGPDAVVQLFLRCVDRGIDRSQALRRLDLVAELTSGLDSDDSDRAAEYFSMAIASFQNLSESDKREFSEIIRSLRDASFAPRVKIMAMSFAFLNLSGEGHFRSLIRNLSIFLKKPAIVQPPPAAPPPPAPAG